MVAKWPVALAEILILFIFFYTILCVMGGTRVSGIVRALVVGFILLYVGVQYVARMLSLERVQGLLAALVGALGIMAIVVFAPDLRRMLARLAQSPLLFPFLRPRESMIVDEIAEAAARMARRRVGALIVIERDIGLRTFTETAMVLDAEVSSPLLENIFYPGSPLHDGAVVIREGRIAAAGVAMPLTENPEMMGKYGMRHRAGVGISEESDAVAVIVSEERGAISAAVGGRLVRDLDREQLRDLLRELLARADRGEVGPASSLARLARMVSTGRRTAPSARAGEAAQPAPAPKDEA